MSETLDVHAAARALGGDVAGRDRILAPGPGHSPRDRSLSIAFAPAAPDGFVVTSFAGDDWQQCRDHVRDRLGLERWRPGDRADGDRRKHPARPSAPARPAEPEPDPDAIALWRAAAPLEGTLGERYLVEHRGLAGPFPPSLRFIRSTLYPPAGLRLPALVAAVARPDRRIIAVQLTYLRPSDGAKATVAVPRRTVGRLGTGAIRLGPIAGGTVGLAEGTETALAAMHLSGVPCWATLGAQRLAGITLPTEAVEVHLFADTDQTGQRAAAAAADRFTREGRRVFIRTPAERHGDWNDVLSALATMATA